MGRPQKYVVRLTHEERKTLFELIEKGRANKEKLNRARILLKADCCEEGEPVFLWHLNHYKDCVIPK